MRLRRRSILSAAMVALSLALVGCDTADTMDKLSDMIPFGDNKKPLPGDRKEVFPQGVPGVPQGVPPDMVKGNQAAEPAPPPQQAAVPPPPAEKPKPKKKVQAKPKTPPPAPGPSAQTVPPAESAVPPAPSSTWPPAMQPASGWPASPPPAAPASR
jgi:hypothetical protein